MIAGFRHKGLRGLFETGDTAKIGADLKPRCIRRLDALNSAKDIEELNVPGFNLHKLRGGEERWALAVNGPWRITFEWDDGEADRVDLEQYH